MTKTKRFRPLTKYRRYEHVYRIYPASATHYDFIGEVRVQKVVEKFSPFMKFSDMYGSFENWLAKQTKKESFYVKNIIRGHGKYPMATLSQLVYKPRTEYGEKKVSEAIKINIPNEEDLKWELRQLADDILVTINKSKEGMKKWEGKINLEEMEGLGAQDIDKLEVGEELNKVRKLLFFDNKGKDSKTNDSFIDSEGVARIGRLYDTNAINKLRENATVKKLEKMLKK